MIKDSTDIETSVYEAMEPFYQNHEVEPYRIHLDHPAVLRMAAYCNLPAAELNALTSKMLEWSGSEGGVDSRGLYQLSSFNPDGRWDWLEIGGRWKGRLGRGDCMSCGDMLRSTLLEGWLPYFVLTPEGEWLERERSYIVDGDQIKTEQLEPVAWLGIVREELKRWPTHLVVCVDIHC